MKGWGPNSEKKKPAGWDTAPPDANELVENARTSSASLPSNISGGDSYKPVTGRRTDGRTDGRDDRPPRRYMLVLVWEFLNVWLDNGTTDRLDL